MKKSFSAYNKNAHSRLESIFLSHQSALLGKNLKSAAGFLSLYEKELKKHMREEETVILPIYARAKPLPEGGPVIFFTGEHKRMLEFIGRMKVRTRKLKKGPDLTEKIIKLFDLEANYKQLLDHHDRRENNLLYPTLDRIATPQERSRLLR